MICKSVVCNFLLKTNLRVFELQFLVYSLQFDEEGTYYVEGAKVDSISPNHMYYYLSIDLFQTSEPPYELVATGGNFMSDGFGTAFSSELIILRIIFFGNFERNFFCFVFFLLFIINCIYIPSRS